MSLPSRYQSSPAPGHCALSVGQAVGARLSKFGCATLGQIVSGWVVQAGAGGGDFGRGTTQMSEHPHNDKLCEAPGWLLGGWESHSGVDRGTKQGTPPPISEQHLAAESGVPGRPAASLLQIARPPGLSQSGYALRRCSSSTCSRVRPEARWLMAANFSIHSGTVPAGESQNSLARAEASAWDSIAMSRSLRRISSVERLGTAGVLIDCVRDRTIGISLSPGSTRAKGQEPEGVSRTLRLRFVHPSSEVGQAPFSQARQESPVTSTNRSRDPRSQKKSAVRCSVLSCKPVDEKMDSEGSDLCGAVFQIPAGQQVVAAAGVERRRTSGRRRRSSLARRPPGRQLNSRALARRRYPPIPGCQWG